MPVTSDMKTYLAGSVLTLATIWKFTAKAGAVVRLTNHTRDIVFGGQTYSSAPVVPTEIERRLGLSPDNYELTIPYRAGEFEYSDIIAGLWRNARVEMRVVNYLDTALGHAQYTLGEITTLGVGHFACKPNIETLTHRLSQPIGDVYSPKCRVKRLGGPGCGVDLTTFTHTRNVVTPTNRRVFTVDGTAQADGYFSYGTALFTSGANADIEIEIRKNIGNTITLMLPLPFDLSAGDDVRLIAGCDRTIDACRDKFSNAINFQGEPYAPTPETAYKVPD